MGIDITKFLNLLQDLLQFAPVHSLLDLAIFMGPHGRASLKSIACSLNALSAPALQLVAFSSFIN